jgi:chaperone modulatory protein CbpM
MKKDVLVIQDSAQDNLLTLDELCNICNVQQDFISNLIEYDIIHPEQTSETWVFNIVSLQRIKRVQRVQKDLDVNLPGVAIILELMDELEMLRGKVLFMENYFNKK